MRKVGLKPYLDEARRLIRASARVNVKYIPREGSRIAGKPAKHGAARKGVDVRSRDVRILRKVRASQGRMVPNGDWE